MKKSLYISVASILVVTLSASDLGTINVSTAGLGQEQSIFDVHASVEVIDEKFIKQTSARSLPQVLNEALGIDVKDSGSTSSASIRGFNGSHTLILVDGLRISGKYGSSDLTSISLENVEKIEIIKGPMSALYGADAMAGVINIITKKKAKKDYVKAHIFGGVAQNGQRETGIIRLHAAKVIDTTTHNIGIEIREKGNYRLEKSSLGTDLKKASKKFISYSNNIKFGENDVLSTKIEFANQDDDGLNYKEYTTYEKEDRYHLAAQHNHTSENYLLDTNFGYSYSDAKVDRGSGLEKTDYKQMEFNSYFRHFTTEKMINIFGVGYRNEKIDVSMYSKKANRDNYNILFQNDYMITDNLTSSIGLRYDNFSDFGDSLNPKVSLIYKVTSFKFRAAYGEAFKAPSFTNMYSHFTRSSGPVVYDISGNENLKPEESKTYEFSVGYAKENIFIDLTHHRTKLDNLIESYTLRRVSPINYTTYQNIAKSSINGTELSLRYQSKSGFGARFGYEHLDTKDDSTGERLTGSAESTIKANLSYEVNGLGLYLNVKQYNNYYASDEGRRNVNSDYTVADVKANYKFNDNMEWFIGVDNIQNKIMPYNMTSRGAPNDPGERYYYTGFNFTI